MRWNTRAYNCSSHTFLFHIFYKYYLTSYSLKKVRSIYCLSSLQFPHNSVRRKSTGKLIELAEAIIVYAIKIVYIFCKICTLYFDIVEVVDNQIVIVDPSEFGEDSASIELVAADISAENERSYDAEKKDIREVSKWRTIAWIIYI